jgi:hypothetical protein
MTLEQAILDENLVNLTEVRFADRDWSPALAAQSAAAELRSEYAENAGHAVPDEEIISDLRANKS